jgi:hypothetical protein
MNGTHTTATTDLLRPSRDQNEEQLRKLVHSETLRHASTLQRLLQYLGTKAVGDPFAEIKEYTIGMDVFERGGDYDPKIDTIVRVQIHRLRLKIKEYYETEGASDQILIDLPKGHYLPTFEPRQAIEIAATTSVTPPTVPIESEGLTQEGLSIEAVRNSQRLKPSSSWLRRAGMASVAVLLFAGGLLLGTRWRTMAFLDKGYDSRVLAGTIGNSGDPAQAFWASFMGSDTAPVVGFADAVFLADRSSDLFRFRRGASDNRGTPVEPHLAKQFASNPELVEKAGPLYYEDGYTGTGDVESVFSLTRLFTQMGLQVTVKRCRLVTIDDLRQHNVILLGSPDQNDAVAQLPQNMDFVFVNGDPPGAWGARFVNRHPQAGESSWYKAERDPTTQELVRDYGLITIEPGVVPGRYIAILAALDTSGVAGDAQFISSPTQMAELTQHLESMGERITAGRLPTFQALLRVDVDKGNDVLDVKLLAVHVIAQNAESSTASSSSQPTQSTR